MDECIFCKIISGNIPASKVYEDDNCIAFLDIAPLNIGHTLVVPKKHSETISDTDEDTLVSLMKISKKVARALLREHEGINIVQNNGRAAGQLVNHIHFHIIPRDSNDGIDVFHWESKKRYTESEMSKTLQQIKTFLKQTN